MSMEVKHLYVTFPTINRSNVERFLVVRLHFAKHTKYADTKYAHTKYASKHAKLTEGEPPIPRLTCHCIIVVFVVLIMPLA